MPETGEGLEVEQPLLFQTRGPDGSPVIPKTPESVDLAKLESSLARAKKGAASGERLYRAGIISKVEAEERALKAVRLEAALAVAQLDETKRKAEEQRGAKPNESDAAATEVAAAEMLAQRATDERHRAELEMALRNLQRQQKLLALGSGRKADVNRAEKKLAELQHPEN